MVRILIADDHAVVRQGIRSLLQNHLGWEICGEASDGRQAVDMAKQLKPDIVVMEIGMPNLNGLEAARLMLRDNPEQKIVIATVNESEQVIRAVLQAGARGYILKSVRGGSAKLLKNWWTWSGSNRRPLPCHGSALPAAPQAHIEGGFCNNSRPAILVSQTSMVV
jgi:CheY-like chemotaxis protein